MKSHEIIPVAMIQDLHWILNVILLENWIQIQNPYSYKMMKSSEHNVILMQVWHQ